MWLSVQKCVTALTHNIFFLGRSRMTVQGLKSYSLTAAHVGARSLVHRLLAALASPCRLLLFPCRSRCRCPGLRYGASLGKGPHLLVAVWHRLRSVVDGGGVVCDGDGGVWYDVGHIIHDHDLVHDLHDVVGWAAARAVGVQYRPQLHTHRGVVAKAPAFLYDEPVLHDVLVQSMRGLTCEVAQGTAFGEVAPADEAVKVSLPKLWGDSHMNLLSRRDHVRLCHSGQELLERETAATTSIRMSVCPQNILDTHHVPKHCADEGSKNTVILDVCVTKFATSLVLPSKNDGDHHTPKPLSENLPRLAAKPAANLPQICRKSAANLPQTCRKPAANLPQTCCIKEKSTKTRVLTNPRFELILKIYRKTCRDSAAKPAANLPQPAANLPQICRKPAAGSPLRPVS